MHFESCERKFYVDWISSFLTSHLGSYFMSKRTSKKFFIHYNTSNRANFGTPLLHSWGGGWNRHMPSQTFLYKIQFWTTFIWSSFWCNAYFCQGWAPKWTYFPISIHYNIYERFINLVMSRPEFMLVSNFGYDSGSRFIGLKNPAAVSEISLFWRTSCARDFLVR